MIENDSTGDEFGFAASYVGDIKNNGVTDHIIGAPQLGTDPGDISVISGLGAMAET